jgi:formate-dependent nitrite reductase cytochrome c552 subunit
MKGDGMKVIVKRIACLIFALAFVFTVTPSFAGSPEYVGYKGCKGCHKKEYDSWKEGSMNFNAFKALLPRARAGAKTDAGLDPNKDYTTDPECLRCHATGYGKPGGFVSYAKTPDLAGVTCEDCHGPGGKYKNEMAKNRHFYQQIDLIMMGLEVPTQATCDRCHTPGCPTESDELDFDEEAAHDNFPLKGEH